MNSVDIEMCRACSLLAMVPTSGLVVDVVVMRIEDWAWSVAAHTDLTS
jgi:hypothetical protein